MSNSFDWRTTAACSDKDPELFFPIGNANTSIAQLEEEGGISSTENNR